MTTNTASIPAVALAAGDTILFRSRFRVVLNTAIDTDDDGDDFVYVVLEALTGQPMNAYFEPDELVAVVR